MKGVKNLAIFGGKPVRTEELPPHITTDDDEIEAVVEVMKKGRLSLFEGSFSPDPPFSFNGGPYVQRLEREWEKYYGVKHAIAVNSATSGLYAAIGASGTGPGDEVIVSPYTMTASATCAVIYNAVPVFADIREDIFCLDAQAVENAITPYTKAIVVIHLFGHPADIDPIMELARKHDLYVIEDCAQVHGAHYKGKYVGTIGDIGVFSLNCNKTIQTGEGGIITTNNDELANRIRLIRNHGEVVVGSMGLADIANTFGWNYRMTEIEAAIGAVQLKKLKKFNKQRTELAAYLTKGISDIDFLIPPVVRENCDHVYYVYPLRYLEEVAGVPRNVFAAALNAEGIPFYEGYVKPLYLLPMYQQKIAYRGGCPFKCSNYKGNASYEKGLCPTAERMHYKEIMTTEICRYPLTKADMDDIINAIHKVADHMGVLKERKDTIKGSNVW